MGRGFTGPQEVGMGWESFSHRARRGGDGVRKNHTGWGWRPYPLTPPHCHPYMKRWGKQRSYYIQKLQLAPHSNETKLNIKGLSFIFTWVIVSHFHYLLRNLSFECSLFSWCVTEKENNFKNKSRAGLINVTYLLFSGT